MGIHSRCTTYNKNVDNEEIMIYNSSTGAREGIPAITADTKYKLLGMQTVMDKNQKQ